MIDLEDVRLARVAQRRFAVHASQLARALEELETASARGERTCLLRELLRQRAISSAALIKLCALRERARPGGLKLISILGKGASATVYTARDQDGREVAVKLFNGDERDFQRAANEATALARLDHPAIPRLLGDGDVEGRRYIAIERVDGESLHSLIRRRERLPWPSVVEIGLSVARALAHAHRRGVIHRDVKPGNVIVSPRGAALVDFGLSIRAGDDDGKVAGTPGFIAPEQARGRAPSARGDVYSLGAVLYFALTGAYPIKAKDARDAIVAAADPLRATTPIAAHREGLPARLVYAVERALEKDPAMRFASADELAAALARVRLPQAITARRHVAEWLALSAVA